MQGVRWGVGVLVVLFVAIGCGKACINFVQFGARSKENEPRLLLRQLASRQRDFFADAGRWATSFEELEFAYDRPRFRYALAPDERLARAGADGGAHVVLETAPFILPRASDAEHRAALPADAWTPLDAGAFVIFASGDIDGDPGLSVWRVSSLDLPCEQRRAPGEACRVVDDLDWP